jgi:hypothetical protein
MDGPVSHLSCFWVGLIGHLFFAFPPKHIGQACGIDGGTTPLDSPVPPISPVLGFDSNSDGAVTVVCLSIRATNELS